MQDRIKELNKELEKLEKEIEKHQKITEKLPPVIINRLSYEDIMPKDYKKKHILSYDISESIRKAREYVEYTKKLEENKKTLEFYHALRKTKGTHPKKFDINKYAELKRKFDQLTQQRKEQISEEMTKLAEIHYSNDHHQAILDATIEKMMNKLDEQPKKDNKETPLKKGLKEELKQEWLSEGILTKKAIKELQQKHPKKDIGREVIDFYTSKKLSQEMIEALPKPKNPRSR